MCQSIRGWFTQRLFTNMSHTVCGNSIFPVSCQGKTSRSVIFKNPTNFHQDAKFWVWKNEHGNY